MSARARRRWVGRSLSCATGLMLSLSVLVGPAAARNAERLEYDLQLEGVVDCGSFVDNFTDFYHIRETDLYDDAGTLTAVVYQAEHHSIDTNSVTGFAVYEHGHFHEVDDFVAGTYTLTGSQEVANRKGAGVVIQDTGRIVLNAAFEPVFFAGGRKHSNYAQGEQIYCDALS